MFLHSHCLFLFFALQAICSTYAQYAPRFLSQPRDISASEYATLNLNCGNVQASPAPTYRWYYVRPSDYLGFISDRHPVLVGNEGLGNPLEPNYSAEPSYRKNNIQRSAAGYYRCEARNELGAVVSRLVNVTVAYLDEFEHGHSSVNYNRQVGVDSAIVFSPPPLKAAPESAIKYDWKFGDSLIYSNDTHFVSTRGALVILNTKAIHSGDYYCIAVHQTLNRNVSSRAFRLTVSQFHEQSGSNNDRIVLPPVDVRYLLSSPEAHGGAPDPIILECVGFERPFGSNLLTKWKFKNSNLVDTTNDYEILEYGRRLKIRNPDKKHSGLYACGMGSAALNGFSLAQNADMKYAQVEIVEPPVFDPLPPQAERTFSGETSSLELPCNFINAPNNQVRWYFNGRDIRSYIKTNGSPYQIVRNTKFLRLTDLTTEVEGVYQCEPYNQAGSALSYTYLRTQNRVATFTDFPISQTVVEGTRVEFRCKASGFPIPRVKWLKNGIEIEKIPHFDKFTRSLDNTLYISDVTVEMSGSYQCVTTDPATNLSTEKSAQLTVTRKAEITDGPVDQSVVIGSEVIFPCAMETQEIISREWLFNGERIAISNDNNRSGPRVLGNGALKLMQVGPRTIGTYTCVITTSTGEYRMSAQLSISEKPGAPFGVKADLVNSTNRPTFVHLAWQEGFDGNSPIRGYTVEYRVQTGTTDGGHSDIWSIWEQFQANIPRDQRELEVDNLKPSGNYQFRVIASNKYGDGISSQPSNNITMPQQPPAAAPQNVTAAARSSTSIILQWSAPVMDQWNGDLLGFFVRFKLANYNGVQWNYRNISVPSQHVILLTDLIIWREYEIQVAAYNQRGAGVYSPSRYVTTMQGVPLAAPKSLNVSVLNSTAIWVSFVPPNPQFIPGTNLGYKIQLWREGVDPDGDTPSLERSVLPDSLREVRTIVANLSKYTTYNVTVACFTAPGIGPKTNAVQVTTKQDIPGPLGNFYYDEVLSSSIKLIWEPPKQPNGILTNYTLLFWVTDQKAATLVTESVPGADHTFKVDQLVAATKYNFEIWPNTVVGRGPSAFSHGKTGVPPVLPKPPLNLVSSNVQARSIQVQFSPGFDGHSPILRWVIEAQTGKSNIWVPLKNISDPTAKSLTIDDLTPFTFYRLRIIAVNVKGPSAPSHPLARFQTNQDIPEHAPNDISAEPVSGKASLVVSWTPLQTVHWNGVPKGYVLFYRVKNNSPSFLIVDPTLDWMSLTIDDPNENEKSLVGLDNFTVYEIQMLAVNTLNESMPSQIVEATTYPAVPSAAPLSVRTEADSSTVLRVSWDEIPRGGRNGVILGYKVFYEAVGSIFPHAGSVDVGHQSHSAELTGLLKYTDYKLSIAGYNIMGAGPKSDPPVIVRTKPDLPGPVQKVIFRSTGTGPHELGVSWMAPDQPNGNIRKYFIKYGLNDTNEELRDVNHGGNPPEMLYTSVSNLYARKIYRFTIQCQNEAGRGQVVTAYAFTSELKTSPQAPSAPHETDTFGKFSTKITLEWTIANSRSAPVRYYDLQYHAANANWTKYPVTVPGDKTTFSVDWLEPNTAYRFKLKAVNDRYESGWSEDSIWIETLEDVPTGRPFNVEARPHQTDSFRVTWDSPPLKSFNSKQVGYKILYKDWKSNEGFSVREMQYGSAFEKNPEYIIDGLKRFTHYLVQVQLYSPQGSGPPSSPVFVYVGYTIPKVGVQHFQGAALTFSSVSLTWDAWTNPEPINGFKIIYTPENQPHNNLETIIRPKQSAVEVRNLQKNTKYSFDILPFNKAGAGPPVNLEIKTLEDVPSRVGDMKFEDITLDSVRVTWQVPRQPNGIIVQYYVSYEMLECDPNSDTEFSHRTAKTTMTELLFNELDLNCTYKFSVRAETSAGRGEPNTAQVKIGPQQGSPAIPSVRSIILDDSGAILSWHGSGPSFIIQSQQMDEIPVAGSGQAMRQHASEKRAKRQTIVGTKNWETLATVNSSGVYTIPFSSLTPGLKFRFRVIAKNRFGVSYASQPSQAVLIPDEGDQPFYYKWWFLVILALAALCLIVIVVALLCYTGRNHKYKYAKKNSTHSLHLSDGGIVTYELRQSQRKQPSRNIVSKQPSGHVYANQPPPRPDPSKAAYDDDYAVHPTFALSGVAGARHASPARPSNAYDSLGHGGQQPPPYPLRTGAPDYNMNMSSHYGYSGDPGRGDPASDDPDTSTTGEDEHDGNVHNFDAQFDDGNYQEEEVSSIAQHYLTDSNYLTETWRRQKKHRKSTSEYSENNHSLNNSMGVLNNNVAVVNGNPHSSVGVQQVGVNNAPGSRAPIPGFSSFV